MKSLPFPFQGKSERYNTYINECVKEFKHVNIIFLRDLIILRRLKCVIDNLISNKHLKNLECMPKLYELLLLFEIIMKFLSDLNSLVQRQHWYIRIFDWCSSWFNHRRNATCLWQKRPNPVGIWFISNEECNKLKLKSSYMT